MRPVIASRILAALLLFLVTSAEATVFVPMAIEDLTRDSPIIVLGTVTGLSGAETVDGRLVTLVDLAVDTVLRGPLAPGPITLREPGGTAGGRREVVFGGADLQKGERVLAFLTTWADGSLRTNQLALGAFHIDLDATGHPQARLRFGPGVSIVVPPGGAPPTAPVPLAALIDAVRRALPAGPAALPGSSPLLVPPEAPSAEPYDEMTEAFTLAGPARHFGVDEGTPLRYVLDANGDATLGFCAVRQSIVDALAAWTNVAAASVVLSENGQTFDLSTPCPGPNKILFNDPFGEIPDPVSCSGVLGVGGFCSTSFERKVFSSTTFDRALRARYVLANGWGACPNWTICNVAEISTHEFGHSIGLGHSADPDATMFATAHFDGRCATVKTDDQNGVTFIYPTTIPPTVTTPDPLPAGTAGVPYSKTLTAIGGTGPYTWADVSGFGFPGLALSSGGVISGTPGAFGTGFFDAKATDSAGASHTKTLNIEVLLPGSTTTTSTSTTSTSLIVCVTTTSTSSSTSTSTTSTSTSTSTTSTSTSTSTSSTTSTSSSTTTSTSTSLPTTTSTSSTTTTSTVPPPTPFTAKKLSIKDKFGDVTKRGISFQSKAAAVTYAAFNPVANGATLHVFNSTGGPDSACISMPGGPSGHWVNKGTQWRYTDNALASGPVKSATIKNGLLKVTVKGTGPVVTYTLNEPSQGTVGVVFRSGSTAFCTNFGGTIKKDSGTNPPNAGGKSAFSAKDVLTAPGLCPTPPASCP